MRLSKSRSIVLVAAAALGAVATAVAAVEAETLQGTVGPAFTIGLKRADGSRVIHLDPGAYTVAVDDQGDAHSFHLRGPGVDFHTDPEGTGTSNFDVVFTDGVYRFFCDIHPTQMNGSFTAGTPPPPPPPPPAAVLPPKLFATVGPGARIILANAAGRRLVAVKARTYRIVVKDLTVRDNFHLVGQGVNRKTLVAGKTTVTWTVKLLKGKTYGYRSDEHPLLKGSVKTV